MDRNLKILCFLFLYGNNKKEKKKLTEAKENATIYEGWNSHIIPETCGLVVHFAKTKHIRGLNSNEPTKNLLRPKKFFRLQWNLSSKTQHVQVLYACSTSFFFCCFFKEQIQTWKIFIIIEEGKWIVNAIWKCYLQRKNKVHYRQKANVFWIALQKWIFSNQMYFK